MRKFTLILVTGSLVVIAGVVLWLRLVTWEHHIGYFAPAFSPDGKSVYAVTRETRGFTWGFGWEHFTPPAYAYAVSDRFALIRIDVATGKTDTLEQWASTPVTQRVIREYRNRVFNFMSASIQPAASGAVRYQIEMAIPKVPSSEVHQLKGVWSAQRAQQARGEWNARSWSQGGVSEPVVAGQVEVFALPGPESFPSAVALLDHATRQTRVLAQSAAYRERYAEGVTADDLMPMSRKKDIDRINAMEQARKEGIAKYRSQGMSEIQAMLKSGDDLEDQGYLPKSPRMIAHRGAASNTALPVFEIADAEMASGIFSDIELAIAGPGAEIRKSMGKYIVHRDYSNSARLNAYIAGGGRRFMVRFKGVEYEIELRHMP